MTHVVRPHGRGQCCKTQTGLARIRCRGAAVAHVHWFLGRRAPTLNGSDAMHDDPIDPMDGFHLGSDSREEKSRRRRESDDDEGDGRRSHLRERLPQTDSVSSSTRTLCFARTRKPPAAFYACAHPAWHGSALSFLEKTDNLCVHL